MGDVLFQIGEEEDPQTSSSCPSTRACSPRLRSPHTGASSRPVRPQTVAQADWRAEDWRRAGDGRWLALACFAWVVASVYGGEIVVGHLLELLDHAFGLLLCHDLAERLEVVDGLPQDLADGVLEDVYTAALPSEGVAAGAVIPQLIVFHLGHLDHSVGGVLGHAGVQGPPLCLVGGDNLPDFKGKMFLKLLSSSEVSDGILTRNTFLDME